MTRGHDNTPLPALDLEVDPQPGADPSEVASEMFVDGLLHLVIGQDAQGNERRVERALRAIRQDGSHRTRLRFPALVRWSVAAAAAVGVCVAIVKTMEFSGSTARAAVVRASAATRALATRRYEIRMQAWHEVEPPAAPNAIMDIQLPGYMVLRHHPPHSSGPIVVGTDGIGPWSIREGVVNRDNPKQDWPPWTIVEGERLEANTLDTLLDAMPGDYEMQSLEQRGIGGGVRSFERIGAERIDRRGFEPDHVELWIDSDTNIIERIELTWDPPGERGVDLAAPPHEHRDVKPPGDSLAKDDAGADIGAVHQPSPPPGRRLPPKLIVIERVGSPNIPIGWFSPQTHVPK